MIFVQKRGVEDTRDFVDGVGGGIQFYKTLLRVDKA